MLFYLCLAVVTLSFVGFTMLIHAAFTAPHAVEDETGFHLSSPEEESQSFPPLTLGLNAPDLAFFNH